MSRHTAHLLMLIAALIWGTTFIAQTTGMETIGPFGFTGARYLIGAMAVLPFALTRHVQNPFGRQYCATGC